MPGYRPGKCDKLAKTAQPEPNPDTKACAGLLRPEPGSAAAGAAMHAARSGVFPVILGASFQLFLLCGFVGWLLHSGRIPDETAPVLSKACACA